jgi:hypothetical protein
MFFRYLTALSVIFVLTYQSKLLAQFNFDSEVVRSKYITPLVQKTEARMAEERRTLEELNRDLQELNGQMGSSTLYNIKRQMEEKLAQHKDVCLVEEMRRYVGQIFQANCDLVNIQYSCEGEVSKGLIYGPLPESQTNNPNGAAKLADPENPELASNLRQLQRNSTVAGRAPASVNGAENALAAARITNSHLNRLIEANNACVDAIIHAQRQACVKSFDQLIGDFNQEQQEYVIAECTPAGVENLMHEFTRYMTGSAGAATVIADSSQRHIMNRQRAIQMANEIKALVNIANSRESDE